MLNAARAFKKTVQTAFEKVDSEIRLHHYKVRNFRGNVEMHFERGHYIVKTARRGAELEECLRLRFEVFHKEYMRKVRDTGVDVDWLDFSCDHLMIVDKRSGRTIGTYRLNSSLYTTGFYSQGEFEIQTLLDMPGTKLELGRACIHKEFRSGAVIALLWRGIAEFIRITKTDILFGCSSIKTIEPMQIGRVMRHLTNSGDVTHELNIQPTKKYRVKQLPMILDYLNKEEPLLKTDGYNDAVSNEITSLIPPLFHSYLRMGAKLCGEPALDREFFCIDFLTLIRVDQMSPTIREKYGLA